MVAVPKAHMTLPPGQQCVGASGVGDPNFADDAFCALARIPCIVPTHGRDQRRSGLDKRLGGLGHLAIQYANKFGYTVVAISRGSDKKEHALELGVGE